MSPPDLELRVAGGNTLSSLDPSVASGAPVRADKRLYLYVSYALIVVYVSISLLPLLSSGYYSDDLINSTIKGQLELQNITFVHYLIDENRRWVTSRGRFFPVAVLTTEAISYVSYHLQLYKILILSMIIMNVLLLGYLLHSITRNRYVSYLGMLLLPMLFQFRLYHDPILAFSGMMQLFVSLVLCAMISLYKYLEYKNSNYLIASLVFYNLSLYTYEVSIFLIPLFLIIVTDPRDWQSKDRIKLSAPYVISVVVALMAMFVARELKSPAAPGYSGIMLSMEPARVVETLFLQLYASLPLSYYAGNPSHLFHHDLSSFVASIARHDIAVWLLFVAFYMRLIGKLVKIQGISALLYLGSALVLFPAMAISISLKYQGELRSFGAGMGYVPVYIQYYGTALFMTGAIVLALQKLSRKSVRIVVHMAVVVVISTGLLVNMQSNRLVVEKANIDLYYRRAALTRALGENILRDVPEHSKVYILDEYAFDPYPFVKSPLRGWAATGYDWKNDAFVYLYAKKRVQIINDVNGLLNYAGRNNATDTGANDIYLLNIKSYPDNMGIKEGYVVLSSIQNIYRDKAGKIEFERSRLRSSFPP